MNIENKKCRDCRGKFKRVVKWWIVENKENFELCQKCSDKRSQRLTKIPKKQEEKWELEVDWVKVFLFLSTITLLIILIVNKNKL